MPLSIQVAWLFILALPIACVSWTVTHEEVFREPRERCIRLSEECRHWYQRKFFYLLTCEYCLSHYITLGFVAGTGYKLLAEDAWGYVIGFFSLVWIANQYMSIFARLRLDIKHEGLEVKKEERDAEAEALPLKRSRGSHPGPRP